MVNEPSVFEPLKFYSNCNWIQLLYSNSELPEQCNWAEIVWIFFIQPLQRTFGQSKLDSRTSVAGTLMIRLPQLFRTRS